MPLWIFKYWKQAALVALALSAFGFGVAVENWRNAKKELGEYRSMIGDTVDRMNRVAEAAEASAARQSRLAEQIEAGSNAVREYVEAGNGCSFSADDVGVLQRSRPSADQD